MYVKFQIRNVFEPLSFPWLIYFLLMDNKNIYIIIYFILFFSLQKSLQKIKATLKVPIIRLLVSYILFKLILLT